MTGYSSEHTVTALLEAWNRRDLDAALALASPDIVYVNSPLAVEPGTRHGHEEFAAVLRTQWDILGDAQIDIESVDAGGDEVVALFTLGRSLEGGSGAISARQRMHCTVQDGLVARMEIIPPDA
jgi:ketosteroid isomerase-like protein